MAVCQFEARRTEIVRNLLKVYRQATPIDLQLGTDWYPEAQRIVREWSTHYRYSVETTACVVAALSPQLEWTRNLVIADDVLAGRYPSIGGVLHSNLRKAEILRDTDYRTDTQTIAERMSAAFKSGPKVHSFAHNLSGDMSIVTVDTHAAQAGLNDPLANIRLAAAAYRVFAECYVIASSKVGRQPAEFQAIVWHVWKRLYPRVWKIQERKQWFVIGMEDE